LFAIIAAAAVWPVAAQESIIFSKPPDDPSAKANSMVDQSHHETAPLKMPAPLFNGPQASPDFDTAAFMPRPQPLSPKQMQELQRQQNERRNWGLMTPAEIFGVPTVEKILGMPVPESEKNLTMEERFLRQQHQQHSDMATNSLRAAGGTWDDDNNPFQKSNDKRKQDESLDPARRNSLFQNTFGQAPTRDELEADQRKNSIFQSVFSTPRTPPKEDPEQVAAMERFRSLLESQPETATPQATPMTAGFQSPAVRPAEYKPPTAYIPAANFQVQRQQQQQMSRPVGVAPLPPITLQPKKKDDTKPLVKPPPWASDQPQPNMPPRWNPF
jgi:hypothetical protein